MTSLSVIIATRDRPDMLGDCLGSLAGQTIDDFEVLVVDDGSHADLRPAVRDAASHGLSVAYVRQDPSGLSAARNHGTAAAEGDALAYLDDDALADPGWARAMVEAFDDEGCDAVAGRIELHYEGPAPRWLSPGLRSLLGELDLGASPCWIDDGAVPNGGNSAVSRAAFERAGGFPTDLGRQRGTLLSNEEVAFFGRVLDHGGRIRYRPDALMRHRIPPSRLTADYFRRRAFAQGVSDVRLEERPQPAAREAWRVARTVPILLRGLARDRSSVGSRAWLDYCRGRWSARRGDLDAEVVA